MIATPHDPAEMRRHLAWLAQFEHGCVQLDLSKGDEHHQSYHASADSLIAEVSLPKYAGWKPQISINPRPAEMAGARFKSCNDEDVTLVTHVRIDFDPVRPLSAATAESVRAAYERERERAMEKGRQIQAVPPALFARVPGAAQVAADGTTEERSLVAAGITRAAREISGAPLSESAMEALVTSAFKAARGQPATDAERELAFEGANTAADLLGELGFSVNLAIDSGNGVHIWLEIAPIEVPDAAARGVVKAGLKCLVDLVRERVRGRHLGLRVDPTGGLSAVTRLAGVLNTKGVNTAERPHRAVAICTENPRGDGVTLRNWLLTEGRRIVEQQAADLEARKAEAEERMKSNPSLGGEPRNFEKRVERAIENQLSKAPIADVGHDDALRGLLGLASLMVSTGLADHEERFGAIVRDVNPHHWTRHGLEVEIEKALKLARSTGSIGAWRDRLLQEDAAQDAAKRGMRVKKAGATKPEPAPPTDDGLGAVEGYDDLFNGATALDTSAQQAVSEDERAQHLEREAIQGECAPEPGEPIAANVRTGPWPGSSKASGAAVTFAFPSPTDAPDMLREPQARVPEPEAGVLRNEDGVSLPPLPKRNVEMLRDFSAPGIAQRIFEILEVNHESIIHDGGRFWIYDGGRYVALSPAWLDSVVRAYHGARGEDGGATFICTVAMRKCVLDDLRILASRGHCREGDGSFFDGSRVLAVFTNGAWVLALDGTPKWVEHSPKHRALHRFELDYASGLAPTHLLAVMRDWFAGVSEAECDARIALIRQYFGHVLLSSLHHLALHVALLLIGKGHDGKSTLINILRKLMPPGSTISMDPAALASKAHTSELSRAMLHGKRANLCGDIGDGRWESTAALKSILSHEPITGRRIGGNPFTFRPTLASVFAGNALPKVADKSHGFFRRWKLVEFPNSIPHHLRDERLEHKLLGLEQQAIVCWLVDAALAQLDGSASKTLTEPACHAALLKRWVAGDDAIATFVREYTEDAGPDKAGWTPTAALYEQYTAWCSWLYGAQAARETRNKQAFANELARLAEVQQGKRGKSNTRVLNRRLRQGVES